MKRAGICAGFLALCAAGVLSWTGAWAEEPGAARWDDPVQGVSLVPPRFPRMPEGSQGTVASFLAPPRDGFSDNVNVLISAGRTTRAQYLVDARESLREMGLQEISIRETLCCGREALLLEYDGERDGHSVRWLSLAVIDAARVVVATCTAREESYFEREAEFRRCLESLRLP